MEQTEYNYIPNEYEEKVMCQIHKIIDSGETNMQDIPSVLRIAMRKKFNELVFYLSTVDRDRYIDYITFGTWIYP